MTLEIHSEQVFEGTWGDIMTRMQSTPLDQFARLSLLEKKPRDRTEFTAALKGKYAHLSGSSEDYALHKQAELNRDPAS